MNPLVPPEWLCAHLGAVTLLDATVDLPAPCFDGDYRVESGADGWRAARIPGARHADLVEALSQPHPVCSFTHPAPAMLRAGLAALGVTAARPTVIYDRTDGFWAARLWWMARAAGMSVQVLDGGWAGWRAIGGAIESGTPPPPIAAPIAEASARPDAWVERADVEAALDDPAQGRLVCALSAAAFHGAVPTRYARRGAIPGSFNLPARDLNTADGRMAAPGVLDALFAERLGADAGLGERLLLYCGGGISAAYLALGLVIAGRDNIAIYDHSLQEWAADPRLPLVCSTPES